MQALLGARGGVDIPEEDRNPVYNHLALHYQQFEKEPPQLEAAEAESKNAQMNSMANPSLISLQKRLDKVSTENQELKRKMAQIEEERHLERVAEVADLRVKAGLAKEREAEIQRYKLFDEDTLGTMKEDLQAYIAEREKLTKLVGPKAKYSAQEEDKVKEKMEQLRQQWFGHKGTPGGS